MSAKTPEGREGRLRRQRNRRKRRLADAAKKRAEQDGRPCCYCARAMSLRIGALYPTLDHVEPRSKGGRITVWSCQTCNAVKRNMTEEQWSHYRNNHPEWWLGGRARKAANWRSRGMGIDAS
jgi:hypothetical protein